MTFDEFTINNISKIIGRKLIIKDESLYFSNNVLALYDWKHFSEKALIDRLKNANNNQSGLKINILDKLSHYIYSTNDDHNLDQYINTYKNNYNKPIFVILTKDENKRSMHYTIGFNDLNDIKNHNLSINNGYELYALKGPFEAVKQNGVYILNKNFLLKNAEGKYNNLKVVRRLS